MSLFKRLYDVARSQVGSTKSTDEPPLRPEDVPPAAGPASPEPRAPSVRDEYYANLELPSGASYDEIKAAYRNLLRRYHPDRHSADPEKSRLAEEISKRLNEAMNYFEKERQEGRL